MQKRAAYVCDICLPLATHVLDIEFELCLSDRPEEGLPRNVYHDQTFIIFTTHMYTYYTSSSKIQIIVMHFVYVWMYIYSIYIRFNEIIFF